MALVKFLLLVLVSEAIGDEAEDQAINKEQMDKNIDKYGDWQQYATAYGGGAYQKQYGGFYQSYVGQYGNYSKYQSDFAHKADDNPGRAETKQELDDWRATQEGLLDYSPSVAQGYEQETIDDTYSKNLARIQKAAQANQGSDSNSALLEEPRSQAALSPVLGGLTIGVLAVVFGTFGSLSIKFALWRHSRHHQHAGIPLLR